MVRSLAYRTFQLSEVPVLERLVELSKRFEAAAAGNDFRAMAAALESWTFLEYPEVSPTRCIVSARLL